MTDRTLHYELAMQLRDAGFPQGGDGKWLLPPDALVARGADRVYEPTLEELIEACGTQSFHLSQWKNDKGWGAQAHGLSCNAATAIEAVARLFLALHAKSERAA